MEQRSKSSAKGVGRRAILGGGLALAAGMLTGCGSRPTVTQGPDGRPVVRVLAFKAPSLGAFLPAVIAGTGIDRAHGMRIEFSYTTPDNYNTEFASGHYEVGASAALLSEALRIERGIDVTYLFNLFDYFTAVVTSDDRIRALPDLADRSLAAATGTTNHAMFEWFAARAGLDLSRAELLNQTPAGLSTMALMGRADATEIWEPAYSSLIATRPDIRTLDIGLPSWQREFGTGSIPYLGVAAHREWVDAHPDVAAALFRIYREAASWTTQHPAEAAALIAKATPRGRAATIQKLIEDPARLRMNVRPAREIGTEMSAVFAAGRATGYLRGSEPSTIVYQGL